MGYESEHSPCFGEGVGRKAGPIWKMPVGGRAPTAAELDKAVTLGLEEGSVVMAVVTTEVGYPWLYATVTEPMPKFGLGPGRTLAQVVEKYFVG